MPLQFKNSEGQVFLGCLDRINYCLFLYCGFTFTEHSAAVVKKANQMLGIIKRKVKNKTKDIIVKLYKALVRPHLKYCIQLWNPSLKCNIKLVESVQRRALKLINGYKNYSYVERLVQCELISLEKRRVRGDLIEMF